MTKDKYKSNLKKTSAIILYESGNNQDTIHKHCTYDGIFMFQLCIHIIPIDLFQMEHLLSSQTVKTCS